MNWNLIHRQAKRAEGKTHKETSKDAYMTEDNMLPRRALLRGALAVGCGLLIPTIFLGCDTKKSADANSAAPGTGSAAASDNANAATSSGKSSQASVQYQTQPQGEQKCGGCINYIADSSTCKLVDGKVSPDGWCILWAKQA